jgi:hypothetical protein
MSGTFPEKDPFFIDKEDDEKQDIHINIDDEETPGEDEDFYTDLQRDMEESDKENLDSSWWRFWAMGGFITAMLIIIICILIFRKK